MKLESWFTCLLCGVLIVYGRIGSGRGLAAQGNGMIRPSGKETYGVVDKLVEFCIQHPEQCLTKRELEPVWPILNAIDLRRQPTVKRNYEPESDLGALGHQLDINSPYPNKEGYDLETTNIEDFIDKTILTNREEKEKQLIADLLNLARRIDRVRRYQ